MLRIMFYLFHLEFLCGRILHMAVFGWKDKYEKCIIKLHSLCWINCDASACKSCINLISCQLWLTWNQINWLTNCKKIKLWNILKSTCTAEYIINFNTFKPHNYSYLEYCIVGRKYLNVFHPQSRGTCKYPPLLKD
jgi:hypothetical protein